MAPSASKANYKSYEAQARLVRAIVAAHSDVKWNYKEIAACYGSDMTEHALNHRFRHIRAQTKIIQVARDSSLDVKNLTADESALPKTVGAVDVDNIAKYFGQSTADGIQFQFRTIKKDADQLRKTAANGGDPSTCLDLGSGSGAPSFTPSASATPKTPRSRNFAATPTTGGSTKRRLGPPAGAAFVKIESDGEDGDSEATHNWSEMDDTPSKRTKTGPAPGQKTGTPSRRAAARASATIADASAQLQTSDSELETPTARGAQTARPSASVVSPTGQPQARPSFSFVAAPAAAAPRPSIFGGGDPMILGNAQPISQPVFNQASPQSMSTTPFNTMGGDTFLGSSAASNPGHSFYEDDGIDGEF